MPSSGLLGHWGTHGAKDTLNKFFKDVLFYLYVPAHINAGLVETRGWCLILWSWSNKWLGAFQHVCWDLNFGPLQESQALLTTSYLSSSSCPFSRWNYLVHSLQSRKLLMQPFTGEEEEGGIKGWHIPFKKLLYINLKVQSTTNYLIIVFLSNYKRHFCKIKSSLLRLTKSWDLE